MNHRRPAGPLVVPRENLRSRPVSRRARRDGFALLITVTLLAFLVLLLVSLASLTRIETQVASNSQALARARQNALLALNIALGQLQRHTGPDQRVTATAEFAPAFERCLGMSRPSLIEVRVDPEALTPRLSLTQIREQSSKK